MLEIISLLGSLASIILFIVYIVGRGITIIMVERLWKDGAHSEGIRPRHTVKSFLYYFCR